jgi:hypothetical protein
MTTMSTTSDKATPATQPVAATEKPALGERVDSAVDKAQVKLDSAIDAAQDKARAVGENASAKAADVRDQAKEHAVDALDATQSQVDGAVAKAKDALQK